MGQKQVAKFTLEVNSKRVLPGAEKNEVSAAGEGRVAGIPVFIVFTHTGQPLPDGSEIATGDGFLRTKEGCDVAFLQGVGGFRCQQNDTPAPQQAWQGAVALKSETPKFRKLNGRVFWMEVHLDLDGNSVHRWFALYLCDEDEVEADFDF
ncbi:hypothetical protein [Streptomyces rimosus]|uniref:hypothetical protein n=1 Tax=Streptomyces rimosus TaxID=1927 RepID=UPI0012FF48F9|nr:hypothetical protein [Streptomyces rimosus]